MAVLDTAVNKRSQCGQLTLGKQARQVSRDVTGSALFPPPVLFCLQDESQTGGTNRLFLLILPL